MKKTMLKRVIYAVVMVCMVATTNLSLFALSANAVPADDKVNSVTYNVTSSGFSAVASFKGSQSGTAYLELQTSSGSYVDSTTKPFNGTSLSISKSRTVSGGNYKLYIYITFSDDSTYERTCPTTFSI